MNIINSLQEIANSLPCEQKKIDNLPSSVQEALSNGDGNKIKEFLSNDKLNADMTRVTTY
ncbi:MAG: hypothetical protein KF702_06985 [Gammaproteobacteria bacterium]|nr:hypothetical protein [Gammaproteobacteria bacterium]